MSDIKGANKKNAALSSLKNVLRKLLNAEKIGAFTKFKIHFYVDRALREDAAGQQANLQEAVQAATFETELRRKQEDGQAQIRFNDMRRESGLKMMKMVFKKLKNSVLIGALASIRRNQAVDQGGDALAQLEARMNGEMNAQLAETKKNAGISILKKLTGHMKGGMLRLSFMGLVAERTQRKEDARKKANGQANLNAQKLHLDLQSAKQGETKKLETKLSAALEENAVLRAKVELLEDLVRKGDKKSKDFVTELRNTGYATGMKTMQKVFQAMCAGSKRGAVINWRVKLVGVPLTKKQLVARYKNNIAPESASALGMLRSAEKMPALPSPGTPGIGTTRRVATHFKKGWLIGKMAEEADLTGQDLRGARGKGADLRKLCLANVNLSKGELEAAQLSGVNLTGANLTGCCLKGANLEGADLSGACLREANLDGAKLSGAKMEGASLDYASMIGASYDALHWATNGWLRRTKIGAVNWDDFELAGADLSGCMLNGASLEGVDLTNACLTNVSLKSATLMHARLDGADMKASNLTDCNLEGCTMVNTNLAYARYSIDLMRSGVLKGSILGAVELQGKDCQGVQLENCDIIKGNFRKAFLISASLRGSNLSGADFAGANLRGTDFANTNLTNAQLKNSICLKDANLDGAVLDGASLPDDVKGSRVPDLVIKAN